MVATTRTGRAVHLLLAKQSPVKVQAVVARKKKRKLDLDASTTLDEAVTTSKRTKKRATAQVVEVDDEDGIGLDELAAAAAAKENKAAGTNEVSAAKKEKRFRSTKSAFVVLTKVQYTGNYDEAFTKLKQASIHKLTRGGSYPLKNGDSVQNFKCLHNTVGCKYKCRFIHVKETNEVRLETCGTHCLEAHAKRTSTKGMSAQQKDYVKTAMRNKVQPETIQNTMMEESPSKNLGAGGYPTLNMVQNFIKKESTKVNKEEAFGNTIAELKEWCTTHSTIPTNDDEVFVVDFYFGESTFKIFLSTRRLLKCIVEQASRGCGKILVCIDATYKINLEKRPVIPCGTVDWDLLYHEVGYCIISERCENHTHFEFTLSAIWKGLKAAHNFTPAGFTLVHMQDNAEAIRNAIDDAVAALPIDERPSDVVKLTCYCHFKGPVGAVAKNKDKIVKPRRLEKMKEDLRKLHQVPAGLSPYVITVLFAQLMRKWRDKGERRWVAWLNAFWRVGVHWSRAQNFAGIVHHNMHLERANRSLKKWLARKRFMFATFTTELVRKLRVTSLVEAQRIWPDAPTITAADWRAAQAYVKSTRDSFVSVSSARRPSAVFLLSQEGNEHLTQRVLNDPNVSAPEYLRGKPNPLFVAELQKRAEKKAQKFEEAFLSDDDKQLKSLTYDKAIKLLRTFHMLEELPEDEKICKYVQFSCTCHGKLGIKHKFGYQCTRKCKHTLAQGLRTGLYVVPCGLELGVVSKPKSAGGRAKKAGKALECESSESDDEEEDDESSEHEDGSEEDEIE